MSSVPTEGRRNAGESCSETRHRDADSGADIDADAGADIDAEDAFRARRGRADVPTAASCPPDPPRASRQAVSCLTGLLLAAPMALTGLAGAAWGAPGPAAPATSSSLAEVQVEIDRTKAALDASVRQSARAAEEFDAGRIRLAAAERAASAAAARVGRANQAVRAASDRHRGLAVSVDRSGGFSELSLLLGGDPRRALDRLGAVDALARRQRVADGGLRLARRDLTEARREADDALAGKKKIVDDLAERKSALAATATDQQDLLGQLQARFAELEKRARARAEAARRARQAAAAAAAAAAARQAAAESARYGQQAGAAAAAGKGFAATPVTAAPAEPPLGSGGAGTAVREAYAQLGKPYVWGAEGPGTFDCSGLTQWVWRKAGVALSHYTGSQWNEGRRVSRAELVAGDLVFFHADIDHVGIYVGSGKMINAPRTGEVVRVEDVWWSSFQGGVRPGA
ncbi:Cell wall-associated hydrolase, invasion-associated protein [Frankia canadensis]|uniref:Cell wall-associated hydrolase, invasion-associated protein n=1 Tax=Frankia canadensis TaxID=1836972 RepID=A0A2I2KWF2_9ACTN|nr:C40 family peptidase [Frankia canadensis]SNQ49991.1 Cell wall-associated hydrolase, invasion-associated protein [Frankia canadensis]SOU57281.1 Cell wall-associated hydrolase, invasion-associated protein [Frankia canadensis]